MVRVDGLSLCSGTGVAGSSSRPGQ
jgi:hypothetical protein